MSIYPILCILYWCRCQYILLSVFSVALSVCLFTALELSVLSDTSHSVCTEIVASHITTKHYNVVMGNKSGSPVLRPEDVQALSSSSGLTEQQVTDTFNAFIEKHPDGKLKQKEFRQMMQRALPKRDSKKMEKHVFRWDLTFSELNLKGMLFSWLR